ncbi:hypothetical protein BO70DRAFT_94352 [Aspergillus heteromorphus CBS 117.55]|uniref:Uncharacterized protein n=1 Tax=Aspergillus heteromorphus CBS 117.55 TaxID=1448321 RepID=A0A317VPK9_9EURO|nr:uncharacterized protein BO70DRAFT_94352 [Aspergillus heteromorphus CBS 117.55]PWY76314.1 hypothetical protein BO70DRAFT_94352 [Aspergillus heteromorphus CBS 117.55]
MTKEESQSCPEPCINRRAPSPLKVCSFQGPSQPQPQPQPWTTRTRQTVLPPTDRVRRHFQLPVVSGSNQDQDQYCREEYCRTALHCTALHWARGIRALITLYNNLCICRPTTSDTPTTLQLCTDDLKLIICKDPIQYNPRDIIRTPASHSTNQCDFFPPRYPCVRSDPMCVVWEDMQEICTQNVKMNQIEPKQTNK